MYKLAITVQLLFVALFGVALIASFTQVEYLKEKSKDQITQKLVQSVGSNIDLAEELVLSKKGQALLADHQIEVIELEISSFRKNPESYVSEMTRSENSLSALASDTKNPLAKALLGKVFSWKSGIKNRFNGAFKKLLLDIRIFFVSNVIGLIVAAGVLYKRKEFGKYSISVSVILSIVIAISALSYLDQNWLFTILLNNYAGYTYPFGILCTSGWLFYNYHNRAK